MFNISLTLTRETTFHSSIYNKIEMARQIISPQDIKMSFLLLQRTPLLKLTHFRWMLKLCPPNIPGVF